MPQRVENGIEIGRKIPEFPAKRPTGVRDNMTGHFRPAAWPNRLINTVAQKVSYKDSESCSIVNIHGAKTSYFIGLEGIPSLFSRPYV
jgi:hypothetical protein